MAQGGQWAQPEKLLLAVLSGVIFVDALDGSLTQIAFPSIGSALNLSEAQLQWIVSAYVLGYGGFLLLGGRCADVFGRKRVFVWGLVALIVASLLGTVVSDGTLLIAARFVKGASAAFTAPAALSILTTSFVEGPHRNRALGVYTAAAACGFTFGLVSGGSAHAAELALHVRCRRASRRGVAHCSIARLRDDAPAPKALAAAWTLAAR